MCKARTCLFRDLQRLGQEIAIEVYLVAESPPQPIDSSLVRGDAVEL